MVTVFETTSQLIGQILNPSGKPASGPAPAPAAHEPFVLSQVVYPLGPEPEPGDTREEEDPYSGPERRAPQVIIAEIVDENAAERRFPPLPG
jgi:hypothetical protein